MTTTKPSSKKKKKRTIRGQLRPLQVRPGARYACFGDGLCCTDIHAIGPITTKERVHLSLVAEGLTGFDSLVQSHVLKMKKEDGSCVLLGQDQRCMVHDAMDGLLLPRSCKRFPIGLTATPDGGRVTVEHRCSCQNLGDAPQVTVEDTHPVLVDRGGRLRPNHRVGARVKMSGRAHVKFATYVGIETPMLEALESGADPAKVLDAKPFPKLKTAALK